MARLAGLRLHARGKGWGRAAPDNDDTDRVSLYEKRD